MSYFRPYFVRTANNKLPFIQSVETIFILKKINRTPFNNKISFFFFLLVVKRKVMEAHAPRYKWVLKCSRTATVSQGYIFYVVKLYNKRQYFCSYLLKLRHFQEI